MKRSIVSLAVVLLALGAFGMRAAAQDSAMTKPAAPVKAKASAVKEAKATRVSHAAVAEHGTKPAGAKAAHMKARHKKGQAGTAEKKESRKAAEPVKTPDKE